MNAFLWYAAIVLNIGVLGLMLYVMERVREKQRITFEAYETMRLLEESLERRLREADKYRHDLAELLHELDPELVRRAERNQTEGA